MQVLKRRVRPYVPDFKLAFEHVCIHTGARPPMLCFYGCLWAHCVSVGNQQAVNLALIVQGEGD